MTLLERFASPSSFDHLARSNISFFALLPRIVGSTHPAPLLPCVWLNEACRRLVCLLHVEKKYNIVKTIIIEIVTRRCLYISEISIAGLDAQSQQLKFFSRNGVSTVFVRGGARRNRQLYCCLNYSGSTFQRWQCSTKLYPLHLSCRLKSNQHVLLSTC